MTVSKEIIEVLDYLGNKFGIAIDWSSENVIPYIQELCEKFVNYKIAIDIFYLVALVIAFAVFTPITIKLYKNGFVGELLFVFFVIACASMIGILIAIPFFGTEIIKCLTFPELAILDYLKGLNL